jgi:multiple sugar transport system permease protein
MENRPMTFNWKNEQKRKDLLAAMIFLLPNFFGILAFVVFPVVFSLIMAFTNWDLTNRNPFTFSGLDNFKNLLWGDEARYFWKYFLNTLYLLMGLPVSIAGSLFLALLLHEPAGIAQRPRQKILFFTLCLLLGLAGAFLLWSAGKRDAAFGLLLLITVAVLGIGLGPVFFRTLFYLPQFTAGVAVYILWKNLFNPEFGLVNHILRFFFGTEIQLPNWLLSVHNLWAMNPETITPAARFFGLGARDALIVMGVWIGIGGANCLLFLAGLTNIPAELYEVAQIDGAGKWALFRHVTWPQLAPTTFFILILSTIAGLQGGFEQARVMTAGGPAGTTMTLGYYIYQTGFEEFRLGLASAIAWIMFLIIFIMTLINWRFGNRYTNL